MQPKAMARAIYGMACFDTGLVDYLVYHSLKGIRNLLVMGRSMVLTYT